MNWYVILKLLLQNYSFTEKSEKIAYTTKHCNHTVIFNQYSPPKQRMLQYKKLF